MSALSAGIDIGSVGVKAILMRGERILSSALLPTGWSPEESGESAMRLMLNMAEVRPTEINTTIATGYGRKAFKNADRHLTEITCHAIGANYLCPNAKAVLDIGGQDSKAICLGQGGVVRDFLMNDKCAAGTGRFLESVRMMLGYEFSDFSELPFDMEPHPISSMCAVFAESEVIGLLARGVDKRAIALGLLDSIASRAEGMIKKVGGHTPIVFTGGLSKSKNLAALLEGRLKGTVLTSKMSQFAGAIGAALLGQSRPVSAKDASKDCRAGAGM